MERTKFGWIAAAMAVLATAGLALWLGRKTEPPPRPGDILQAGAGKRWIRGNLHAHTRWSDGAADGAAVAAWYRGHGYDFLALTDHNVVPGPEDWHALVAAEARPGKFLLIRGEEVSNLVEGASVHLNALGVEQAIAPVQADDVVASIEQTAARLDAAPRAPGTTPLLQLNHPNFWYSVTAEQLLRQRGTNLFEVFNAHELSNSTGDGLRPPVERMWDIALAWRLDVLGLPPLYGTASDDSHGLPGADRVAALPGRAWITALVDRLDEAALFDALRRGRFYASTGVELERIVASPSQLQVDVVAAPGVEYAIEFIGTRRGFDTRSEAVENAAGRPVQGSRRHSDGIGRVLARVDGPSGTYRLQPDDLYVRARITATARHPDPSVPLQFEQAWVQPVVGPAGRAPNRPHEPLPPTAPASLHARAQRFAPISPEIRQTLLATSGAACSLDLVADRGGRAGTTLARAGGVMFGGWVLDPEADRAPDALTVLLQGERAYEAAAGASRARPDVAAAYGKPGFEGAGFSVDFGLTDVEPGEYPVTLVARYGDRELACDTGRSLRVD